MVCSKTVAIGENSSILKSGICKYYRRSINDYVIQDYHVNKKYGLDRFATVGALVVNEDCSDLDNADVYKEFYIGKKQEQ